LPRQIAEREGVREGLIALFSCVEPCRTWFARGNRATQKLELKLQWGKCGHLHCHFLHEQPGFLPLRLHTWFPFLLQVCLNGREWLARQLDAAGIAYRREDNCLPWLADLPRAQALMAQPERADRPALLRPLVAQGHPLHAEITRPLQRDSTATPKKLYDQGSVLRSETTINEPKEFRVGAPRRTSPKAGNNGVSCGVAWPTCIAGPRSAAPPATGTWTRWPPSKSRPRWARKPPPSAGGCASTAGVITPSIPWQKPKRRCWRRSTGANIIGDSALGSFNCWKDNRQALFVMPCRSPSFANRINGNTKCWFTHNGKYTWPGIPNLATETRRASPITGHAEDLAGYLFSSGTLILCERIATNQTEKITAKASPAAMGMTWSKSAGVLPKSNSASQ
jgi:hypothetical protein